MSEYQKAWKKYNELATAAKGGDKQAHADKAKAMLEVRNIERQAAREGTVLGVNARGETVVQNAPSKRSLQEEYVRSFDDKNPVKVSNAANGETVSTLQEYHRKRLLGK